MAYAPHTNLDHSHNPEQFPMILGSFAEVDHSKVFEYSLRNESNWLSKEKFPHLVYVGSGETRYAKVLKTVAYVVIDEDENGEPVIDKWYIKKHRVYPQG